MQDGVTQPVFPFANAIEEVVFVESDVDSDGDGRLDNRSAANLTAVLVDYSSGAPVMVTRGWLDPQNRHRLNRSRPIKQGRQYRLEWDLQPDGYIFRAGHRIGLGVVSTDYDYTLRPLPGTELTLDPSRSEVRLPVVGGKAAFGF